MDMSARIKMIGSMEDNWDGYHAKPVTNKVIERAIEVSQRLLEFEYIFPTGRNSIQFETDYDDGSYLEVEVHEDCYGLLLMDSSDKTTIEADISDLNLLVYIFDKVHKVQ